MNQRWWWQSHPKEDLNELNFLWTQWKVDSQFEKLPSKIPKLEPDDQNLSDKEDNEPSTAKTENDVEGDISPKPIAQASVQPPLISLPHDSQKCYNRLENNFNLTSKKYLYLNMKEYYNKIGQDVFSILPVTFHVKEGETDTEFIRFTQYFQNREREILECPDKTNAWIIKPGENSNRGAGITVCDNLDVIKQTLNDLAEKSKRTCIIQEYIEKPLLINKRKFDIRIFTLITSYNEGYVKGKFLSHFHDFYPYKFRLLLQRRVPEDIM